ncbi:MAG: purine-nucleoside phosphorylase [Deltaproteobacteria bacterium]|nr:purine-nucleoside phosphorylase [Deltaproteobacteria bacterium]
MNSWTSAVEALRAALEGRFGAPPGTAIVLGSGQSEVAEMLAGGSPAVKVPSSDLPGIPGPSVEGHRGELIRPGEKDFLLVCGRLHLYEGHSAETCVRLVRALARWGVKNLVLTNASGSLRREYKPGQIVILDDHINLSGANPLEGKHVAGWGTRFPDMNWVYDLKLRKAARRAARRLAVRMKHGIYVQVRGPSYETPAEVKAFARLGGDVVGMSTAIEAIAARHLGMRVLGLSVVTNLAGGFGGKLSHDDVVARSKEMQPVLARLIEETLRVETLSPRPADRKRA